MWSGGPAFAHQVLDTLVRPARLLAGGAGDDARALCLAEFVRRHPAAWQETREQAARLRADLAARLPAQAVQAALQAAATLDLDGAVGEAVGAFARPRQVTGQAGGEGA